MFSAYNGIDLEINNEPGKSPNVQIKTTYF